MRVTRRTLTSLSLAAVAILLLVPAALQAQEYSRFSGSLSFLNTQPVGQLATGPGFGIAAGASYALDSARLFRIHGEFRAAIYDHESDEVCFSETVGCRIQVDLNTNYSVMYAGIGPELALPLGSAELALNATAGWGGMVASSSLSGVDDSGESIGETTNYEDHTFAWSAGGALRIPVGRQLALSLGGAYQHNGTMSYVREGGIIDHPDGSISFDPFRTDANLFALTIGIAYRPLAGQQ